MRPSPRVIVNSLSDSPSTDKCTSEVCPSHLLHALVQLLARLVMGENHALGGDRSNCFGRLGDSGEQRWDVSRGRSGYFGLSRLPPEPQRR